MAGLKKYLLFVVMVAAVVFALRLLNWVPLSVEKGTVRKYRTIEDVQRDLGIRKILLPSYFPQRLSWPPSEIFAQSRPYPMIIMYFTDEKTGKIVLAISQTGSGSSEAPALRIEPHRIVKEEKVMLKGREARLYLASCRGGGVCNSLTWQEADYSMKVVDRGPEKELIRISESMLSE
ncbi:MAG: hypothetical protein P8013_02135 [Candidatus Sulfobium sp.]